PSAPPTSKRPGAWATDLHWHARRAAWPLHRHPLLRLCTCKGGAMSTRARPSPASPARHPAHQGELESPYASVRLPGRGRRTTWGIVDSRTGTILERDARGAVYRFGTLAGCRVAAAALNQGRQP